jgi:tape measure domain-containing protein
MTNVDTLVTKFTLDSGGYIASASKATAVVNAFTTAATKAAAANKAFSNSGSFGKPGTTKSSPFGSGKAGVSTKAVAGSSPFAHFAEGVDQLKASAQEAIAAFTPLRNLILGLGAVGAAGAAAGFGLAKQAAEFDSLRQSLVSVEGDARKAADSLKRLKDLAKAPGLGFEEAVRGYTGLRNAGLTQQFADELIKQFANANARGGGNAETFGRILTQVRQAAGRPFLAQEDLTPIGEAGIPINKVLKDAFGTGDTEELKSKGIGAQQALEGIVKELAKLQRVAGGAQNEFDNIGDALKFAGVAAGEGINQSLLPYLNQFATAIGELTDGGEIQAAFSTAAANIAEVFAGAGGSIKDSLREVLVGIETASAGFRNLVENTEGFGKKAKSLWDRIDDFGKWIEEHDPTSARYGKRRDPAAETTDSLFDENARIRQAAQQNAEAAEQFAKRDKDDADIKKSGFKGGRNAWRRLTQAQRDYFLKNGAGGSNTGAPNDPNKKTESLLERIAINTGKFVDMLEDAQSGGGTLAKYAIAAQNVSGGPKTSQKLRRIGA